MGVPSPNQKKRWPSLLPLFVALVVVLEIAFLGRLDMAKNAAMVHQWTTSFYFPSTPTTAASAATNNSTSSSSPTEFLEDDDRHCQDWLEEEDAVPYSRDFRKDPIIVSGIEQDWSSCSVGCKFGFAADRKPDAAFGLHQDPAIASVLRSMESSHYYSENNINVARGWERIQNCNDN